MSARACILVAIIAIIFGTNIQADDGARLPSRKASVVLPLLNKIGDKNSPEEVVKRLKSVLGEPDSGVESGAVTRLRDTDYYWLEDHTEIIADYINNRLTGVSILLPGQTVWKVLYTHPEAPQPPPH